MCQVITGEGIPMFRMATILMGLRLEAKGLRMTRGRSCLSIVKSEFGIKARTAKQALPLFEKYYEDQKIVYDATH